MAIRKVKLTGNVTLDCGCKITATRTYEGNASEAHRVKKLLGHQLAKQAQAHVCPPKEPEEAQS